MNLPNFSRFFTKNIFTKHARQPHSRKYSSFCIFVCGMRDFTKNRAYKKHEHFNDLSRYYASKIGQNTNNPYTRKEID